MLKGLTSTEVTRQREKYGINELPEKKGWVWPKILISQFINPTAAIIFAVCIISVLLGEINDAFMAGAVILVDVAMGFYQEYKAERTFKALRDLIRPVVTVIRDSKRLKINSSELVPGDLVVLSNGDRLPADGVVIENADLLVNEAILTGEQEPIKKDLSNDNNSVYMGTIVSSGQGIFRVEKIGAETKFGKISQSLVDIKEEPTDLQKKISKFSKSLVVVVLIMCVAIFLFGIITGGEIWEMFRLSIILVIAAIPEGLPIVITVVLALGMKRILKRQGLVKRLVSIETLGATTVICTDKTGTLTEGVMKVVKTDFTDEEKALTSIIINNEQKSGMELALWDYAKEKTKDNFFYGIVDNSKKIFEVPFDSKIKYHLTVVEISGEKAAYLLGAPEIILESCSVSDIEKNEKLRQIEIWATEGLRILGVAIKKDGNLKEKSDFEFLGLVGIKDPIRKTVRDSIMLAEKAGVEVKIITGDYRLTAENVARQVGLAIKNDNVMEGWEIEQLSDNELSQYVKRIRVFARVTPEHKLRIVNALQKNGEIVAMTGDGVNDAPALKKADIGMVVNEASDVAKEAADLILLDSNFKTIVAAIEEGRLIFFNIKKVVAYILSNSFVEIVVIAGAMILKMPAPLTILQILTIHLVCDGPPDIILGFDKKQSGLMDLRPQDMQKEKILSGSVKFIVFAVSFLIGLLILVIFSLFKSDLALAQTIAFATVGSVDLVYIFSFRNLKKSVFNVEGLFSNPYLFLSIIYGYIIILMAIYSPSLNKILGTVPLDFSQWMIVLGVGIFASLIVEVIKLIDRSDAIKRRLGNVVNKFRQNNK
jgi:Ca2+-transporting ATPase